MGLRGLSYGPERLDFGPERADIGSDKADSGPEGPRRGCTDEWMYRRTDVRMNGRTSGNSPVSYRTSALWGCAQKVSTLLIMN